MDVEFIFWCSLLQGYQDAADRFASGRCQRASRRLGHRWISQGEPALDADFNRVLLDCCNTYVRLSLCVCVCVCVLPLLFAASLFCFSLPHYRIINHLCPTLLLSLSLSLSSNPLPPPFFTTIATTTYTSTRVHVRWFGCLSLQ